MPKEIPRSTTLQIVSWTLFDFANTAFSVIIVTVIFSRYFTNHVAGGQRALWGLAVSLSMMCAATLSPPLGAAADFSRTKKRFLLLFTLVCVVCTSLLFFVEEGMIAAGIILFVFANIGFEGGLVFYDAFLPGITTRHTYGRVSGYGFAMGYIGALASLLLVMAILPDAADPDYYLYVRLSFVLAAMFFLVFSVPMFLNVPEPAGGRRSEGSFIGIGIRRARETFSILFITRKHPSITRFLISFFLYNDAIITVIAFAALFAEDTLHMSDRDIIVFFAIVQSSAIAGSVVFGIVTDHLGPKKTISLTLILWIGITIGAYFVRTVEEFYIVALAAGVAIGSSQSASRSMMALLAPPEREAEFFGFYDGLCGKASAVVGPIVYGVVADFTNDRVAALALSIFFLTGLWLLQRVEEPPRRAADPQVV